jgi:mRNA-degrading endonuclease RelE of RelBE toxin-antitoxin system
MDFNSLLTNTCSGEKKFCDECSHFMELRPLIKEVVVSKHFTRDIKDEEEIETLVREILECSHVESNELHKFEEKINGNSIFRARKHGVHFVYCVDADMRLVFLRAIKNYEDYKKFLENKREIETMVEGLKTIR